MAALLRVRVHEYQVVALENGARLVPQKLGVLSSRKEGRVAPSGARPFAGLRRGT